MINLSKFYKNVICSIVLLKKLYIWWLKDFFEKSFNSQTLAARYAKGVQKVRIL